MKKRSTGREKALRGLLALSLAVCLAGCQKTPDAVKERMSGYGENAQKNTGEASYCTVEELRETDVGSLDLALDNMKLPDGIDFSGVEDVCVLELSTSEGYVTEEDTENRDKIMGLFGIKADSLENQDSDAKGYGETYNSGADGKYLAICENGFVSYISGLEYDVIFGQAQPTGKEERHDLALEDVSGETVEFREGGAQIGEVCRQAESWMAEHMPMEELECRVSEAYAQEVKAADGEKSWQLCLRAEPWYKGIRFNDYLNNGAASQVKETAYGITLYYDGMDAPSAYINGGCGLRLESAEEADEVVDFASAVRLANEKVSSFQNQDVTKVFPMYVMQAQYEEEDQTWLSLGQKFIARPVYAFLIKAGEEDFELGITKANCYNMILVDMLTGEITVRMDVPDGGN